MSLFLLQGSDVDEYFCRMVWRVFVLLLWAVGTFGFSVTIQADSSVDSFAQWNEWKTVKSNYDAQKYDEALKALKEKPSETANYYYNLGTISYQLNELGMAIAYLEKANSLQPHDSDIQFNLSLAQATFERNPNHPSMNSSSSWLEQGMDHFSLDEVRAFLGFFGLVLSFIGLGLYLKTRSINQSFQSPLGKFGLICFVLATCVFTAKKWSVRTPPAISIQNDSIRSGPGEHYSELARLEIGTKVRLLPVPAEISADSDGSTWRQIKFSHDGIGWVKISNLLVL